jgi:hypothetical protein
VIIEIPLELAREGETGEPGEVEAARSATLAGEAEPRKREVGTIA